MTTETQPRPQTPYERLGGRQTLRAIVDRFYDLMDGDPAYAQLRAMHAADLAPMRESLTGFMVGWSGGPRDWFEQGKCVMSLHGPLGVTEATAQQWLGAMARAIEETVGGRDPEIAKAMNDVLQEMAKGMAR
ncbi:group II truncated hemoglobin [Novosphingobium flavum]|uniref:Group II truncated hemoglobin n=1 Tax=Novosphingobium flavum TaxID=1778672 RepID=A0A7X1FPF3_9SPHN|nr:group II truncated hemoglobin [Novosphingobium flavum]